MVYCRSEGKAIIYLVAATVETRRLNQSILIYLEARVVPCVDIILELASSPRLATFHDVTHSDKYSSAIRAHISVCN